MTTPPHTERSADAAQPAWTDADLADPHAARDKADRVRRMFGAIAPSYDLNNRLHSMWRDQAWRRKAVRLCRVKPTDRVLDVACGTGDLALAFAHAGAARVVGVDFTPEMLVIARQKAERAATGLAPCVFTEGDAMQLPIDDQSVEIVSIAFGIRNVAEPARAVAEFARVLRPGGRLCILEFSLPTNPVMRSLYNFYFKKVMPRTATLISGDRSGAYKYLPQSVNTFLGRDQMSGMMLAAGFCEVKQYPLTCGIAVIYLATKPA